MNIFVLDPDPIVAASYHCDQHLHKMILESAQMLSTAARARGFTQIESWLYQSAYQNHPCTKWAADSNHHMHWVCTLATELDSLRSNGTHSSMDVIHAVKDYLEDEFPYCHYRHVEEFVFAGYPHISVRPDLTIPQKYQLYYQKKHQLWRLTAGRGMTYKGRPVPPFMQGILE